MSLRGDRVVVRSFQAPQSFSGLVIPMPIRFRCTYCNQLLGISRRKAGSSVRCPTCAGQVPVPEQDESSTVQGREDPSPFVFDRNDFDDLLLGEAVVPVPQQAAVANGSDPRAFPSVNAPAGAWGTHAEPAYRERTEGTAHAPQNGKIGKWGVGLYLSRKQLIVAGCVAALAIVLAFGLGLVVGMMLAGSGKTETTAGSSEGTYV